MNFIKWLGYISLCGLFIWFVFFRKVDANAATQDNETNISETITDDNTTADSDNVSDNSDLTEENPEEVDNSQVVEPSNSTPIVSKEGINLNSKYLIVVGSFGVKSNSAKMLKRVKDSGKDGVVRYINGLHRVITASTDNEADAENLKAHFTHIYKERAFILEQ